jgi:hypothetical protein
MFIDPNLPDFPIWRAGEASVVAKFRVVGVMERANGNIYLSPYAQPYSFDTSKAKDPTRGVMSTVQLQAKGLTLDQLSELEALEVRVETAKGQEVEHFLKLEEDQAFEYGSKFPLVVVVRNWKLNKQTIFFTSIEKMRHETLPDEVIFHFKVEKKEERLEVLTDHPKFEAKQPEPEDGDGQKPSEELSQAEKDARADAELGLSGDTRTRRRGKGGRFESETRPDVN